MQHLDFDSVGQAPGYPLITKSTTAWELGEHPRNPDGTFKHSVVPASKTEAALQVVLAQPLLNAESLDLRGLSLDESIAVGRRCFEGLMQSSPIRCAAIGGADVVFDEHGWKYITDESYARQFDVRKDRSMEEVKVRLSLLPKAAAAIAGATSLEGPARTDHGTKRFPIIARFKDGDVIRVILEEHQEGGHRFLSVFDLERVAKKLKRASAPGSLHKSSHSTVQGAATGDGLFTCIVGDAVVYVNFMAKSVVGDGGDTILRCSTVATQAGIVGREDGVGVPVLKAILGTLHWFVNDCQPDYDSLSKAAGHIPVERHRASHEPTPAQFAAGNYPKRKIAWRGLTISIENEAGSVRCGQDPNGHTWETRMVFPYGYINRTLGVDGDAVDVYIGPDLETAPFVYVVHQRRVGDWHQFDEDKCMLGFASEADAVHAFLRHYDDFRFLGPVTAMPVDEFVDKARATLEAPAMIKAWDAAGLDFGQAMLAKAEHGPIPAGAHWITARAPGHEKGQPLLVMPQSNGAMRVIGGAGGALNHLTLRSVGKGETLKDAALKRKEAAKAKTKAQTDADKASGVHEAKQAERGKLKHALRTQREAFVKTVADAMGWQGHEFDEGKHAHLSPEAQLKAQRDHNAELFRRAKEAVAVNRKMLLNDHDARAASGLGEVPLQTQSADTLSVADLDPLSDKPSGLGFAPAYGKRAAAQGLTPALAQALKQAVPAPQPSPAQAAKTAAQKVQAKNISQELDAFKLTNPETHQPNVEVLDDAKKAAAMVLAHKKLKLAEQMARKASADLAAASVVEPQAYALEVNDAEVETAVKQQMEQDIKTIGAASLLSEIGKMGGEESLGGHVAAGAFNSLNGFAAAVGGEPLIDRSVVDVLGINAAAQVLARRIAQDYSAQDLSAILAGVEDYHVNSQHDRQTGAVQHAQQLAQAAKAIELPKGATGHDLAHAQALNRQRRDAVNEARRVLGQATGELQANAALVMALREGAKDRLEVSLGKLSVDAAVTQLHALGLKPGDYTMDEAGGSLLVGIQAVGLDRLAKPVDVAGLQQVKRNLSIISGAHDEEGWLPQGFANRPDLAMTVEAGVAPKLAKPIDFSGGIEQGLRGWVGGRMADGAALEDILADAQSADFMGKSGNPTAYRAALDAVMPLKGEGGKLRPIETLRPAFEAMADAFVADHYGPGASPLHKQGFELGDKSVEALHRALSETPEGVAAFKAVGDLTPQARNGLRAWWESNVGREDAASANLKADLAHLEKQEPEKESTDMFGETSVNPQWHEWKAQRDDLATKVNAASLTWAKYVDIMGSPTAAVAATQDLVRSKVLGTFAHEHNKLVPGHPLKVGKTTIQGALQHLDAVDPAARAARQAKDKALIDALRERIDGKYASGTVADKIKAHAEAQQAFEQAQMGFFSTEDVPGGDLFGQNEQPSALALGADERATIGHAAEQKLAGMMSVVGQNFRPGKPTKLWHASMSGRYVAQQRAVKLMATNKRVLLAYGAGSGKTGIALGATAHLIKTGQIKRALHLVPSIVQDQYGGEATRYLEPGQFKWHCQPGAQRAERIAAYKDPSNHFAVMTHEAFRADMLHMAAGHAGVTEKEMTAKVNAMTPDERQVWAKETMEKEGINFDATFVDEAHQIVNRAGKENSARANVIDAVTDNTPYYAYMSGDPIKNSMDEAHDVLSKMDRARYQDRDAFMRMYGGDTLAAKAGLKRELARYGISNTIAPNINAKYQTLTVPLSDTQRASIKAIDKALARLSAAKVNGTVDVDAAKTLSPQSFDGVPDDRHEVVAHGLQDAAGIVRESALKRIINASPLGSNAKIDKMLQLAEQHKGQPGVVFAHNRAAVAQIIQALQAKGHRVTSITGSDSAKEKATKQALFQPEQGEPKADIMVCSDAGAVGMNLQRGQWLVQHDVPDTAKDHGQRAARIHRLGQKNNVSVYTLAADHPSEANALRRLQRKYQLRELMLDPMDGLDDTGVAGAISKRMLGKQQATLI